MSKTIWISSDDEHSRGDIWSAKPLKLKATFVSKTETGESDLVAYGADNDFFGVAPGECRRFQVIPDDDWIPVEDDRKPEDWQAIWVACDDGDIFIQGFDPAYGWLPHQVAWCPVIMPEPYKSKSDDSQQ